MTRLLRKHGGPGGVDRSVARPREFDVDEAADRARDAFWAGGYEGTGMSRLCRATGQSVGSLYKAFGSKAALHRAGLRRYLVTAREELARTLAAPNAVDGLGAWLEHAVATASAPRPRAGCYAVLAEAELAATAPDVAALIREHDEIATKIVAEALRRSPLRAGTTAEAAAALLVTLVKGLQLGGRSGVPPEHARDVADTALAAILEPTPDRSGTILS